MSTTFARLIDPTFEDDHDPFRHYDASGEPWKIGSTYPAGLTRTVKSVGWPLSIRCRSAKRCSWNVTSTTTAWKTSPG